MRTAKLGGKSGSNELQEMLPWRTATAPPAIKKALLAADREPYTGPPVPVGYMFKDKDIQPRIDFTSSSDQNFAFQMLDASGAKMLPRPAARDWFRCMGW